MITSMMTKIRHCRISSVISLRSTLPALPFCNMSNSGSSHKRTAMAVAGVSSFFAPRKKIKTDAPVETQTSTAPTEAQLPSPSPSQTDTLTKVFVDLDGVLVDFDQGVQNLTGHSPTALSSVRLWSTIAKAEHFFRHLPWTRDGEQLWEALRVLRPSILTGVPRAHAEQVARDKYAWCQRELCVETVHWSKAGPRQSHAAISKQNKRQGANIWCKVITCWSRNKFLESAPGRVLIDDRLDLRESWESRGGIFIHHVNTEQTLRLLNQKKILPPLTPPQQTEGSETVETKVVDNGPAEQERQTQNSTAAVENEDSLLEKDAATIDTESQPFKASGNL